MNSIEHFQCTFLTVLKSEMSTSRRLRLLLFLRAPPSLGVTGDPVLEVWLGVSCLQPRECPFDVVGLVQMWEQLLVVELGLAHVEVRQNIVVEQMAILLPCDVVRSEEWGTFRTASAVLASKE